MSEQHYTQPRRGYVDMASLICAPRLPPELCDIVMDFNHDDRESLACCSLVCKSWTPTSRLHIWSCIRLTPSNIAAFSSLVRSHHTTFLSYIRVFEIENAFVKIRNYHKFWDMWEGVIPFLFSLTRMHGFRLSQVSWGLLDDMKWSESVLATFSAVTNLHLSNVSFHDTSQVLAFLCNFTHLEHLTVAVCFSFIDESLFCDEEDDASDMVLIPDSSSDVEEHDLSSSVLSLPLWTSLRTCHFVPGQLFDVFGLHVSSRQDIFTWMSSFSPPLCLRELSLYSITSSELEPCGLLLQSVAKTIENLSISFLTHFLPAGEVARHVNISSLLNLSTLHIRQIDQEPCDCTKLSATFLLLSQIRSQQMKSLVLTLSVNVLEGLHDDHWAMFSRCLALPQFHKLETIKFNIHYSRTCPSEEFLRLKLTGGQESDVLRFDFVHNTLSCRDV